VRMSERGDGIGAGRRGGESFPVEGRESGGRQEDKIGRIGI